jgi:hypothetical protein
MTEWEVTRLFEERIAAGLSLTQTLRGTGGALETGPLASGRNSHLTTGTNWLR